MRTVQEIRDIKVYLKDRLHSARLEQQRIDQQYFDDSFEVALIKSPKVVHRIGLGAKLIGGPASHVITTNPQVTVLPKKENKQEQAKRVNALLNNWIRYYLLRQNPPPFRESVFNLLLRGEYWIHPVMNPNWKESGGLPVYFLVPDPMTIFASLDESSGVPKELCMVYNRSPFLVKQCYSHWNDPKHKTDENEEKDRVTEWMEYWNKDVRYFEADEVPMLVDENGKVSNGDGIQENFMGVMPFIHGYSGFGKDSPEGKIEELVVGRLRHVRALMEQATYINSDILSIISKFAHERIDISIIDPTVSKEQGEAVQSAYNMGAGHANLLPYGIKVEAAERLLPGQELFQFYDRKWQHIHEEAPPVMSGLPSGTSGRQEDILGANQIRRFDSVVESVEEGWSKAFDMGLQILKKVGYLPITSLSQAPESNDIRITEEDINACAPCRLTLKTKDPIEDDRKLMAGRTLWKEGMIDHKTMLVQFAGYTPDEADEIIVKTQAEKIMREVPEVAQSLGQTAMKDLGMEEALAALDEQLGQVSKTTKMDQSRSGNIKTPLGMEMADMALANRGTRTAPMPYTQGE